MVGLNLDITERKQTEETLRINQERLALALDSGSDGLWDWTIATGEVWFSDRWMTMLGYEPGELAQEISTWERLIHPEDRAMAISRTTAHFEGRTAAYECEHRLRRKDGGWGWVLARGKVVSRTSEGHPIRIVGTHVDIDERKSRRRPDCAYGSPRRPHGPSEQDVVPGAARPASGRARPLWRNLRGALSRPRSL